MNNDKKVSMTVEAYTDGSSLRNPGPSGLAYIIRYYIDHEEGMPEPKEIEFSQGFRLSTNNRMEIMAVIYACKKILELIDDGTFIDITQVQLTSDSEYVVKAINQNWISKWQTNGWMTAPFQNKKPHEVANKDLWEQIIDILESFKSKRVTLLVTHVPGHSGHEFNERCDELARRASDGELLKDEVYETIAAARRN